MATPRRKPTRKRPASRRRRAPLPPWLLLGGGLVAGIAGAMLFETVQEIDWGDPLSRLALFSEETAPSVPSRKFEFYTLLRDQESVVDGPLSGQSAPKRSATSTSPATSGGTYYLQVGSFRKRSTADSMKARVTLLGTRASIEHFRHERDTWYRVRVGPYPSIAEISNIRARLKEHKIDSLLFQAKR